MTVKIPLKAKLDILPAIASVWLTIVYALIVGLFNRRAKTWYLHVCYAVLRRVTRRLSPLQMQYVLFAFDMQIKKNYDADTVIADMFHHLPPSCTRPT